MTLIISSTFVCKSLFSDVSEEFLLDPNFDSVGFLFEDLSSNSCVNLFTLFPMITVVSEVIKLI